MKLVQEIKENKGKVIKKGLIILGVIAGVVITGLALKGKSEDGEDFEEIPENSEE
jgi:hypothetical protein